MSLIFDKKYKLDSSDKFDEYMKAVGESRRHADPQDGQHRVAGGGAHQKRRQVRAVVELGVQEHVDRVQTGRGVRRGDAGRPQGQVGHHAGRQQAVAHAEERQARHHHRQGIRARTVENGADRRRHHLHQDLQTGPVKTHVADVHKTRRPTRAPAGTFRSTVFDVTKRARAVARFGFLSLINASVFTRNTRCCRACCYCTRDAGRPSNVKSRATGFPVSSRSFRAHNLKQSLFGDFRCKTPGRGVHRVCQRR